MAVGPYWNMGGISALAGTPATSDENNFSYNSVTGVVTVNSKVPHKLWVGARVKIEGVHVSGGAAVPGYEGLFEITEVLDSASSYVSYFRYQLPAGLTGLPGAVGSYRVVSGMDYLVIEGNHIQLTDLDATEFAIKDYPLAPTAVPSAQSYRAYGIVVADNGLSALAGPYAHLDVAIRNNRIRYTDGQILATLPGIGAPAGAAMLLAGIARLEVTHNVLEVNIKEALRTYRCGVVRFFNNRKPSGQIRPGWKGEVDGFYDEPETLAEDAFILSLLERKRR